MWKQWINVALGILVLVVPFAGLTLAALTWTVAIAGIIIALLALWSATEMPSEEWRRRFAHR